MSSIIDFYFEEHCGAVATCGMYSQSERVHAKSKHSGLLWCCYDISFKWTRV